jgi:hypothetical protein
VNDDRKCGRTISCAQGAADVLEAMQTTGHEDLHDDVVLFIRALAVEAGAAADAGRPPPGLPTGDSLFSIDVPHTAVLAIYGRTGPREFRVTNLIWLG